MALFAIDSNSDYLNPTAWRGRLAFHFADRQRPRSSARRSAFSGRHSLRNAAATNPQRRRRIRRSYEVDHGSMDQVEPLPGGRFAPRPHAAASIRNRRGRPEEDEVWKPGIGYHHNPMNPVRLRRQQSIHRLVRIPPLRDHQRSAVARSSLPTDRLLPEGTATQRRFSHPLWYFQRSQMPDGRVGRGLL